MHEAAALPLTGLSAWQALVEHAQLRSGQRVLIHGGGGTVGYLAVQLVKALGAHAITTSRATAVPRLLEVGADEALDYSTPSWADQVAPELDVVLNLAPAGAVDLHALAHLVRPGGVLVTAAAALPEGLPGHLRALRMASHPDAAQLTELVDLVDEGELRLPIAQVRSLVDLPDVHAQAAAGLLPGKVVICVND